MRAPATFASFYHHRGRISPAKAARPHFRPIGDPLINDKPLLN